MRVADVRSPERACRSEPELVSEAAKRAGASLGGRSTTTYRTIDARLPSDCERLLCINSHSLLLSFFPKNAFGSTLVAAVIFPPPPFCLPVFLTSSFRRPHPPFVQFSIIPVRSFFPSSSPLRGHSHKSFRKRPSRESLGKSLLTDPLGYRFSRILWEIAPHGSFGKSLLTDPLGNCFSRIL